MRILYSHRIQSHDGQSVHVEELVTAFRQAGHNVVVIGPRFYEKANFGGESQAISLIRRILPGAVVEFIELLYNIPIFIRLVSAYKRHAPDFVYERYNLYYLGGILLKWCFSAPFYLEINSPLAEERTRFGRLRLHWLAERLEKLVWRAADRVFVVTGVLGEIVAASGVEHERITVIHNGVDRERFPLQPYQARRESFLKVGFVGFVREWHGLDSVVAGLASERIDPPIRLVVVGPVSRTLISHAEALGVAELVQFTGLQPRHAIPDLIGTFDIALQASAVSYASPIKLFEYMACGRAIVAPDQPNIREILTNGKNSLLFDPDKPTALWTAIRDLAADPALRERLGRAARETLNSRNYTWDGNVSRVTSLVLADFKGKNRFCEA